MTRERGPWAVEDVVDKLRVGKEQTWGRILGPERGVINPPLKSVV